MPRKLADRPLLAPGHVAVSTDRLWLFVLCTTRYSLGRMSYIVGECADMIRDSRPHLLQHQVEQLASEIREHLDRHMLPNTYIEAPDLKKVWTDLADELENS